MQQDQRLPVTSSAEPDWNMEEREFYREVLLILHDGGIPFAVDGADVVHLIRKCGANLDWDRLLQILHPHWELLYWALVLFAYVYPAQTSLVPERIWGDLTQRFINHISHPRKDDPFRGSLIDPYMFAIDVNEWGERDLYRENAGRHLKRLQQIESPTENTA